MYGKNRERVDKGDAPACTAIRRTIFCAALACLVNVAWAADSGAQASVTILVYHRFSDTADDSMTVRMATFEAQLRFLHEHGYHIVPLREAVEGLRHPSVPLPSKPVAITVDDGSAAMKIGRRCDPSIAVEPVCTGVPVERSKLVRNALV